MTINHNILHIFCTIIDYFLSSQDVGFDLRSISNADIEEHPTATALAFYFTCVISIFIPHNTLLTFI